MIVKGEWGWVIALVVLATPMISFGGFICGVLVMPFYGLARLVDRDAAELMMDRMGPDPEYGY